MDRSFSSCHNVLSCIKFVIQPNCQQAATFENKKCNSKNKTIQIKLSHM
jgi:hypothetical protein